MEIKKPDLFTAMSRSDLDGLHKTVQHKMALPVIVGGLIVFVIVVTGALIYGMSVRKGRKNPE